MTGIWRARAAVLTLVGVLGVHEVRYLFAAPEHEHALAAAHAYLAWLGPVAAVLLFLAVVELVARLVRPDGHGLPRLPRARILWPAATMTLLGVFGAQECVETLLAHGHAPGPAELLGGGGWTAVPAAVLAGGAIALLLRGAAVAARWAMARRAGAVRRHAAAAVGRPRPVAAPRTSVLARRLAGRGPPTLS